jgi:hypothetical protein
MTRLSDAGVHRGATGEIRQEVDGFTRIVAFEPGYNDPQRGPQRFGRHGMQLRFVLLGPLGATQFLLYTPWIPDTFDVLDSIDGGLTMPADFGYHWSTPQYEDQGTYECEYLEGGKCYYDGSGLAAGHVFHVLVEDGIDALWALLRARYDELAKRVEP